MVQNGSDKRNAPPLDNGDVAGDPAFIPFRGRGVTPQAICRTFMPPTEASGLAYLSARALQVLRHALDCGGAFSAMEQELPTDRLGMEAAMVEMAAAVNRIDEAGRSLLGEVIRRDRWADQQRAAGGDPDKNDAFTVELVAALQAFTGRNSQ